MTQKIEIRKIHPLFGAELVGLRADLPLDDDTLALLRRAFADYRLLVVRDFDCDARFQDYFSQALIGNEAGAKNALECDVPFEMYVSNKRERSSAPFGRLMFHADMMWAEDGYQLLSLYGIEVDQPAVPTLFASTIDAWKTLAPELRAKVRKLSAVHGHDATAMRRRLDGQVLVSNFEVDSQVAMPVARRHPRTGETMLYVSEQMTCRIEELDSEDSETLLEQLFNHLARDEAIVEHHWRKNDLVLWDNVALQHARPNVSTDGPARTLRKVFAPHATAREKTPVFSRASVGS